MSTAEDRPKVIVLGEPDRIDRIGMLVIVVVLMAILSAICAMA